MQGRPGEMMSAVEGLVESAREVELPPEGVQERVRGKLARRIAGGAALSAAVAAMAAEVAAATAGVSERVAAGAGQAAAGQAAAGQAAAGQAATAGVSEGVAAGAGQAAVGVVGAQGSAWLAASVAKIAVVSSLVVGGAAAGGWYWAAHERAPTGVAVHTEVAQTTLARPASTAASSSDEGANLANLAELGSLPKGEDSPSAATRPSPMPRASSRVGDRSDPLQDELALLRSAQRNLDSGQIAAAKAELRRYAERFPAGLLRAEHGALRILTLCAEGDRSGAEREIQKLKKSDPDSPVLRRLRQGCPRR